MKKDKKYESAALGSFVGMVGIAIICIIMISINYFNSCNTSTTDTPKQIPTNFYLELDTLKNNLDSLDKKLDSLMIMEIIVDSILDSRWEGQEGKTGEWGEYVPNKSDEHVMWITGDGDTIWE